MINKKAGLALAEIIIGASIMSIAILAVSSVYARYVDYALSNDENVVASYVLEEGVEVMTFFRDVSWLNIGNLSTTTTYYLTFSGNSWATSTTPQYVDGKILRRVNLEDVRRDINDDIAVAGTVDSNIKKITVTVEYFQGHATTTKSLSTYLTNI
ncbi:MAG: hypothetical protein V4690_03125 [Patescibacteria group bacterium]